MHVALGRIFFVCKIWEMRLKDLAQYFDGLEAPNDEDNLDY